jgi:hypothetical protein
MKSEMKRLYKMTSLRQLRSVQRENEAAKMAAAERVKSASSKVVSVSEFVLLLVKRYAPAGIKEIIQVINQFSRQ